MIFSSNVWQKQISQKTTAMNKIKLIIAREYLTRVRKRSFIVMTILGPILMAAMIVVPVYLATLDDTSKKRIAVIDETGLFFEKFENDDQQEFHKIEKDINIAKLELSSSDDYALLYIPKKLVSLPTQAMLYSDKQPNLNLKSYIERVMSKEIEEQKLLIQIDKLDLSEEKRAIALNLPESIKTTINLSTIKLGEGDEETKTFAEVSMIVGIFTGLMIYFFIFIFGAQIMRGVIEEKTSRIIEVIVSSVKPFQIMMGKILGIALVGLTQLLLWVVLTTSIIGIAQLGFDDELKTPQSELMGASNQLAPTDNTVELSSSGKIWEVINSINFGVIILTFAFYFLAGYLLYAALFAAVGSAVDNETDTQQFMLPITIPLILSIIMAQFVIRNPDGAVAVWMSIIPLTSPIIMMVRIPFGVPYEELALSMGLLILGFLATTWLAARIYRIGILMYGKKPTYKEIWKWIRYKG
jgi:ABC-2 type transport system permease protein